MPFAQLAGPHATADHDILRRNGLAVCGAHTGGDTILRDDLGHMRALEHPRAAHARAPGQRHGHVHRVHTAVFRNVEGAGDVREIADREHLRGFLHGNLVVVDPEAPHEGRHAPHLVQAFGVGRNLQIADLAKSRRDACLGFQFFVEIAPVGVDRALGFGFQKPGHDQPGGMPCRAAGELSLLQNDHVAMAQPGQVIGRVHPDGTAANDHGLGMAGQGVGQTSGFQFKD